MDFENIVGQRAVNKQGQTGVITKVDSQYVDIDFGGNGPSGSYRRDSFLKGFFRFADEDLQKEIDLEIEQAAEKSKKDEEEAQARRKAYLEEEKRKAALKPATPPASLTPAKKKPKTLAQLFQPDYHVQHLSQRPIYDYKEVEQEFGIRISGFGRGINVTDDAIVLISSVEKKADAFVYHDKWTEDGAFIYSGEGKLGDQVMEKGNKAIFEAASNGKPIIVFVKFSPEDYRLQGEFELEKCYQEEERDENGGKRLEWKFRLVRKVPADRLFLRAMIQIVGLLDRFIVSYSQNGIIYEKEFPVDGRQLLEVLHQAAIFAENHRKPGVMDPCIYGPDKKTKLSDEKAKIALR